MEAQTSGERRTAKVFMSGRSQAVRIPAAYRFKGNEVYVRRDPHTGDLVLSEKPSWEEIFAELRAAKIPKDFFGDREQGEFEKREELL